MQTPIMADVGLRRVDMLLQNQVEILDAPDAIELSVFRFVIRFENVSFRWQATYPLTSYLSADKLPIR